MEKVEHGNRLAAAIARKQLSRTAVADVVNRDVRTVTNWTRGKTMPSLAEREMLRRLVGPYDADGDPVEIALRSSDLTEDRQYDVIGYYKRRLREQGQEAAG